MHITYLMERFCEDAFHLHGYSADTIRRYRSNIKLFSAMTGVEEAASLTADKVRAFFFEGRSQRHWSASTFQTYHKTLAVFFRWCVKHGHLAENPSDGIEKPKLGKRIPPKLTEQDAQRLLELVNNYPWGSTFLRHRNHAIFATLIFAGLRKRELLSLTYHDVDLANLVLYVRHGKGDKDRLVPICRPLAELFYRYLVERQRLRKTCPEFFTSLTYNQGFTASGFKHLLEQVIKAFGTKFSAHRLRHTFATLMIEAGCDIYALSKMMGHSDIKTTTVYLSASTQYLRTQIAKHPLSA